MLAAGGDSELGELTTRNKNPGVFFTISLLLVVFITNTPLRGLWSAIVVLSVLLGTVTLAWMGLWGDVLHAFGRISIHLSVGFYLIFSGLLFLLWVAVVFGLDRTHYWRFRPGQLTRELVMGGGEKSYDTGGMSFEKLRDDPFRHYLLGLGSGDLVINTSVRPAGAAPHSERPVRGRHPDPAAEADLRTAGVTIGPSANVRRILPPPFRRCGRVGLRIPKPAPAPAGACSFGKVGNRRSCGNAGVGSDMTGDAAFGDCPGCGSERWSRAGGTGDAARFSGQYICHRPKCDGRFQVVYEGRKRLEVTTVRSNWPKKQERQMTAPVPAKAFAAIFPQNRN